MNDTTKILFSNVPSEFLESVKEDFLDYSVAMFLYDEKLGYSRGVKDAKVFPNASGTLISCRERFGVLTAQHVAFPTIERAQADGKLLALVGSKDTGHFSIPASHVKLTPVGRVSGPIENERAQKAGPDLCLDRVNN